MVSDFLSPSTPGDITVEERVRAVRYAPWFEPILNLHPKASVRVAWHRSGRPVPGSMTLKTLRELVAEGKIVISIDDGKELMVY